MNKYLFIISLFVLFSFSGRLRAEEAPRVPDLMSEVKQFLDDNDISQAILTVKEILRIDPNNARAQTLLEKLNAQQQSHTTGVFDPEIEARFAQGQKLWQAGKLREATHLFQGSAIHPPYYAALEKDFLKFQKQISEQTAKELIAAQKILDPIARGDKLKKILAQDPDATEARDTLAALYQNLNEAGKSFWIRASTLHQLEGCASAIPFYQQTKEVTHFPEVPLWQKANLALSQCNGLLLTQKRVDSTPQFSPPTSN